MENHRYRVSIAVMASALTFLTYDGYGQVPMTSPQAPKYVVVDLGVPAGNVFGINDPGQVIAFIDVAGGYWHSVRTAPNAPIDPAIDDLGTLIGWQGRSVPWGINNSGQVVGWSDAGAGYVHGFRTGPNVPINPSTDDLGTLSGASGGLSQANRINSAGQATGYSLVSSGWSHAFRTAPNAGINPNTDDLGTLGGLNSGGFDINDSGQVVGSADTTTGETHAFRTAANARINPATDDLGTLGGRWSVAYAVNSSGQVVGSSLRADGKERAFLASPNHPINAGTDDLGVVNESSDVYSRATGINDAGDVVGFFGDIYGIERGFIYRNGVMYDVNTLVAPDSDWLLEWVWDINGAGQIVGNGYHNGESRAFRLDPMPAGIAVGIAIKPGTSQPSINGKSEGMLPVAILSTTSFNAAASVDQSSLTFGRTGDEHSLVFCSGPEDVNHDGLLDLVCHFDTQLSGFQSGDTHAVLNGKTLDGLAIEGSEAVRVLH